MLPSFKATKRRHLKLVSHWRVRDVWGWKELEVAKTTVAPRAGKKGRGLKPKVGAGEPPYSVRSGALRSAPGSRCPVRHPDSCTLLYVHPGLVPSQSHTRTYKAAHPVISSTPLVKAISWISQVQRSRLQPLQRYAGTQDTIGLPKRCNRIPRADELSREPHRPLCQRGKHTLQ